ncbi:MAG: hypothetical protein LUH15_08095 [Tannerellaceae bacterium]|nr:hypothetical protein [Tannerellaceae bacterium]
MYTFDSLEDIRELELFVYEGPEKVDHNFQREDFLNVLQVKRRNPDILENIRRKRMSRFSDPDSIKVIVEYDEDLDLVIRQTE